MYGHKVPRHVTPDLILRFYATILGESHQLLPLDKLVATLVKVDIRAKIMAREDNFEKLFKCTSKASSEYDDKTAEMIQLLHKTRDGQVMII